MTLGKEPKFLRIHYHFINSLGKEQTEWVPSSILASSPVEAYEGMKKYFEGSDIQPKYPREYDLPLPDTVFYVSREGFGRMAKEAYYQVNLIKKTAAAAPSSAAGDMRLNCVCSSSLATATAKGGRRRLTYKYNFIKHKKSKKNKKNRKSRKSRKSKKNKK